MEDELAEANSRAEKAERLASEHDNARKRAEMFERDMLVWKERAQQAYQAMDRIAEERDRALEATRSAGHKVDCGIDDDRRYLHETLRQALQRMHEMSAENGTLQDENAVLRATLSQYTRSSSTSTTDTRVVSHDWIPTPEGRTECGRCGRERSRVDDLDEPCPRPAPRRVEEPDALKLERAIQQAEKVVARKSGG
jgi:chromosome segregation ATPase